MPPVIHDMFAKPASWSESIIKLSALVARLTTHRGFIVTSLSGGNGFRLTCDSCGRQCYHYPDNPTPERLEDISGDMFQPCDHLVDKVNHKVGILEAMMNTSKIIDNDDQSSRFERLMIMLALETEMKEHGHAMSGVLEINANGNIAYLTSCIHCHKTALGRLDMEDNPNLMLEGSLLTEDCTGNNILRMIRRIMGNDDGPRPKSPVEGEDKGVDFETFLNKIFNEALLDTPNDPRTKQIMQMSEAERMAIVEELHTPNKCAVCGKLVDDSRIEGSEHHFDVKEGKVIHLCLEHCPYCGPHRPGQPTNNPYLS